MATPDRWWLSWGGGGVNEGIWGVSWAFGGTAGTEPVYGAPFMTFSSPMIEGIQFKSTIIDTITRRSEIDENE